jgi:hypothetical protein
MDGVTHALVEISSQSSNGPRVFDGKNLIDKLGPALI